VRVWKRRTQSRDSNLRERALSLIFPKSSSTEMSHVMRVFRVENPGRFVVRPDIASTDKRRNAFARDQ